jgi:hypothetical protein
VKIVALRTEYIVHERYINATGCLNIILQIGLLPEDGDSPVSKTKSSSSSYMRMINDIR